MTLDLTAYKVGDEETADHSKFNNLLDAVQAAVVALQAAPPATPVVPGAIFDYGAAAAPTGWLLCDGAAVSRTTYADLFAVVGTIYGAGDGSTTFNVPDARGRVSVGYAASGGHSDVATLGNNDGVAEAHRRPKHRHSGTTGGPSVGITEQTGSAGSGGATGSGSNFAASATHTHSVNIGADTTNDPLHAPAYLVVNRIIKT